MRKVILFHGVYVYCRCLVQREFSYISPDNFPHNHQVPLWLNLTKIYVTQWWCLGYLCHQNISSHGIDSNWYCIGQLNKMQCHHHDGMVTCCSVFVGTAKPIYIYICKIKIYFRGENEIKNEINLCFAGNLQNKQNMFAILLKLPTKLFRIDLPNNGSTRCIMIKVCNE